MAFKVSINLENCSFLKFEKKKKKKVKDMTSLLSSLVSVLLPGLSDKRSSVGSCSHTRKTIVSRQL